VSSPEESTLEFKPAPDSYKTLIRTFLFVAGLAAASLPSLTQDTDGRAFPAPPPTAPPVLEVEGACADSPEAMQRYRELIPGVDVTFEMVPMPGGTFRLGSPDDEEDRGRDEGPQCEVRVSPFWIELHEVRWDEYTVFTDQLDVKRRKLGDREPTPQDAWSDAVSRPTPAYVPMDFSMGIGGYPAICMTQFAAKQYTKWLSMKTGRFYRLPTEAEWEYACRAGTTTAYSWGDDPDEADEYAWYFDNSDDGYAKVMTKKPNPWGLFDMHGNVSEWVLDAHSKDYSRLGQQASPGADELHVEEVIDDPLVWPRQLYPRIVRGGSWDDDIEDLRSAKRRKSLKTWKVQDPQLPKSIWYHTDARFVGFRVVRPFAEPSEEEKQKYWEADLPAIREIQERQRKGGR
jgi:formylglycine-generating enzyme required for sulfatase activity